MTLNARITTIFIAFAVGGLLVLSTHAGLIAFAIYGFFWFCNISFDQSKLIAQRSLRNKRVRTAHALIVVERR